MDSECCQPVKIGSEKMVTINQLVNIATKVSGKTIQKKHIDGPLGVRGRNSDNQLILENLGWKPDYPLEKGIKKTYDWISQQISQNKQFR